MIFVQTGVVPSKLPSPFPLSPSSLVFLLWWINLNFILLFKHLSYSLPSISFAVLTSFPPFPFSGLYFVLVFEVFMEQVFFFSPSPHRKFQACKSFFSGIFFLPMDGVSFLTGT